jgi:hypothetical protein
MKYKIDKNILRPNRPSAYEKRYPLGEMEPGDSFTFAEEDKKDIANAAQYVKRKTGMRFSIQGLRIWRIK